MNNWLLGSVSEIFLFFFPKSYAIMTLADLSGQKFPLLLLIEVI